MNRGKLIVLSAPSGCGKGTILNEILTDDGICCAVSATTRAPRDGEKDGINYYYITVEQFEDKIKNGELLEYTKYCDNYYGTLVSEVDGRLDEGKDVILEIEVQGAMNMRKLRPDAVFIFVVPPSLRELERRLRKRGTETDEVIAQRIAVAAEELKYAPHYDYIIVNDAIEDAVSDFKAVIKAESLKTKYATEFLDEVKENA